MSEEQNLNNAENQQLNIGGVSGSLYCLTKGEKSNKKYFGLHKINGTWEAFTWGENKDNAYHFLLDGAKDVGSNLKCNIEPI